jgi:hypothetical protein
MTSNPTESPQLRIVAWVDLLTLGLMSLAAPWLAAYLHSAWVYQRGFRIYNAEVGGKYFLNQGYGYGSMEPGIGGLIDWVEGCGILSLIIFLGILWLKHRTRSRWVVWGCFVALWTFLLFQNEVAVK